MASITVTKKKQKQKIKEPQIKITWKDTGDCNGRAWGIIGGKCGVCYPIAL